jgi:transcriptional regulator with XRE-family HTH domain
MTHFHTILHRLRKRYVGKQLTLAGSIGCTEAAVSYWERGRRRPLEAILTRITECFRAGGARQDEIDKLQRAYAAAAVCACEGQTTATISVGLNQDGRQHGHAPGEE